MFIISFFRMTDEAVRYTCYLQNSMTAIKEYYTSSNNKNMWRGFLKDNKNQSGTEYFEKPRGRLLSLNKIIQVEQAISLLARPGSPYYTYLLWSSRSALPPIHYFSNILEDAWLVLQGDTSAAKRFRDALDAIDAHQRSIQGENNIAKEFEELFTSKRQTKLSKLTETTRHSLAKKKIVSLDNEVILIVAAFHANPGNPASGRRHAGIIADQLSRYTYYMAVYHYALEALAGSEAGKMNFRGMLCCLGGLPGDGESFPFPSPPEKKTMLGPPIEPPGPSKSPIPGPPIEFPPIEFPPIPLVPFLWPPRILLEAIDICILKATIAMSLEENIYSITDISPAHACGGEYLTITGSGFGNGPGKVRFRIRGTPMGSQFSILANAITWTDTKIIVVVPYDAGCGIELVIPNNLSICGKTLLNNKQKAESKADFKGSAPDITLFSVNASNPISVGYSGASHIEPGDTLDVVWSVCAADHVAVEIWDLTNNKLLAGQDPAPFEGNLIFKNTNFTSITKLGVKLIAEGNCTPPLVERTAEVLVLRVPNLKIEGIEITQGIQRFWRDLFFGGPVNVNNQWGWNTVPTVANKDTIVRVYVSCDRGGFENDQIEISGSLQIGNTTLTPINGITPTNPNGSNPFIIARRLDLIDRGVTDHTLNFRIPASMCTGTKNLEAKIWVPQSTIPGLSIFHSSNLNWTWQNNNALPVRFVRIRDNRPGGTGTRPTRNEARFTIDRAFDLFPSPATDIGPASHELHDTTHLFETDNGLNDLLDDLDDLHGFPWWEWWPFGSIESYIESFIEYVFKWVGLTSPFNRGLAERPGNTSISCIHEDAQGQTALQRIKTAHEVSHNLGFKHVNRCCGTGCPGGSFYNHPNNGDLLDVPFDPYWNQAVNGSVQDYMSYACTRYVSADSWIRLLNEI